MIAIDTETCDPNLKAKGPGGFRGDGFCVGISVYDGHKAEYFPIAHADGVNLDKATVVQQLKERFSTGEPKVFANAMYDLEWLDVTGIPVCGPIYDIQIAEPLLDENRFSYSLNSLAEKYLGETKKEAGLYIAAAKYGIKLGKKPEQAIKENLWRFAPEHVAPYAKADAELTYKIFELQHPKLMAEDLWELFTLESKLTRVLFEMRKRGVLVDVDYAQSLCSKVAENANDSQSELDQIAGMMVNVWAGADIAQACDSLGLAYLKTDKGAPSFPKAWLGGQKHEFFKLLLQTRQLDRAGAVYIQTKILDYVDSQGRIYPQFTQMRGDDGGTSTGRFSSKNPNFQQFPSDRTGFGKQIRACFLPEHGAQWGVFDHSQQEPRIATHYAILRGDGYAKSIADEFSNNLDADYYETVSEITGVERSKAKAIFLGLCYGMGKGKLKDTLGISAEECEAVLARFHARLPFAQSLSKYCTNIAKTRGYVKTLLGRRRRFDLYGPYEYTTPLPLEEAKAKWGNVSRYFCYKALNAVIQGSAADMIKHNMVSCYEAGYLPMLTIHDELDFNIYAPEDISRIKEIMETSLPLKMPLKVTVEIGGSWGAVE